MKYKKIIEDKKIDKDLRRHNISRVARAIGKSRQFLYGALSGKILVSEKDYVRLKKELER